MISSRSPANSIIVGEVRGEEALDMLQAMNTGHDGSLTTIHANSPRDAVSRVEDDGSNGQLEPAGKGCAAADRIRHRHRGADCPPQRRHPAVDPSDRDHRHGRRRGEHAGHFHF